jgi:hypothetical protein
MYLHSKKDMKIAVLTLAIGDAYKEKVHYAHLSKKIYCEKHSYDLIDDESVWDTERPISWSKICLLKKYLPLYDYVVWMDADAMITNMDHKLEDKIGWMEGKDIMVVKPFPIINLGVMFLRNSPNCMFMLDEIYWETQFIFSGNWENDAFVHLCDNNVNNFGDFVEVKSFAYEKDIQFFFAQWKPCSFMMHLAGWRDRADALMSSIFKRFYPLQRKEGGDGILEGDVESDETYVIRMGWVNEQSVHNIYEFYTSEDRSFLFRGFNDKIGID